MPKSIDILPLRPEDRDTWEGLWKAYLAFYETALSPEVIDLSFTRYSTPAQGDMLAWLAWQDGRAIGLVHVISHAHGWKSKPVTYLQDLFVAPEARRKGIGAALIDHVCADAATAGRPSVYWLTQSHNATARRLYDRVATDTGFIKYAK
ncbi:GNAT family N-acetyltransferase [Rhodobacterales bacterium LSUCC0387]|nr:GNAT family N-acetyltransferase [Rhodobacterales bacterium LSUCC0374]MBF9040244.1 GNAT family N-acetyltransferase [Rhodobacterales bacterium LSUCC0387]